MHRHVREFLAGREANWSHEKVQLLDLSGNCNLPGSSLFCHKQHPQWATTKLHKVNIRLVIFMFGILIYFKFGKVNEWSDKDHSRDRGFGAGAPNYFSLPYAWI